MTDTQLIRLCAEAMGYSVVQGDARYKNGMAIATIDGEPVTNYDPLKHDAQAMALIKKFRMDIRFLFAMDTTKSVGAWEAVGTISGWDRTRNADLNRAVVECVAKWAHLTDGGSKEESK